jgi:hypothetical protein
MELWELEARESVRDLVARYNANGDSGRFDPMMELFAPDAMMEVIDGTYEGRDQIRGLFTETKSGFAAREGFRYVRHYTATHQIDVDSPERALGRCYYAVIMAHGLDHWGRYLDEYTRIEGRWFFARRKVTVDGRHEGLASDGRDERLLGPSGPSTPGGASL